jgi:DNA-binding transcriptional regulator LsrR (DeoR family)
MRKTREILRLHFKSQMSPRQIAAIYGVGKGTVQRYVGRFERSGLSWPLPIWITLHWSALVSATSGGIRLNSVHCRTARRFTGS